MIVDEKDRESKIGWGTLYRVISYSVWIRVEMQARGALGGHTVRQKGLALELSKLHKVYIRRLTFYWIPLSKGFQIRSAEILRPARTL